MTCGIFRSYRVGLVKGLSGQVRMDRQSPENVEYETNPYIQLRVSPRKAGGRSIRTPPALCIRAEQIEILIHT